MKNIIPSRPRNLAVRYVTQLCDRHGRPERVLSRGRNMITDWGMDMLPVERIDTLTSYLLLSSTSDARKRVGQGGNTVTVDYAGGPGALVLTCAESFFEAGDVGRTFKIDGWPEMLITAYTSGLEVSATARAGVWLPGFVPSPGAEETFGVHYSNLSTLATYFTKFNTYDTAAPNYFAEISDAPNKTFVHQRIFLSGVVGAGGWTVMQLGWGNGNVSNNVFGVSNLASADVVPEGKRYRVILQIVNGYEPIDLAGVVLNWGPVIGEYTVNIRMERLYYEATSNPPSSHFLCAKLPLTDIWGQVVSGWGSAAYTFTATQWQGQAGYTELAGYAAGAGTFPQMSDSAYTNGHHTKNRRVLWPDTTAITGGVWMGVKSAGTTNRRILSIVPTAGTFNKPSGYWCDIIFPIHWTREFLN